MPDTRYSILDEHRESSNETCFRFRRRENFAQDLTITDRYDRIVKVIDIGGDNFVEIDGLASCEILDF
jgi:hypothetical protein